MGMMKRKVNQCCCQKAYDMCGPGSMPVRFYKSLMETVKIINKMGCGRKKKK